MRWFGISLGEGNAKVGKVFTFSLPSKTTCPGASPWCLSHCYAYRYEKRRPICKNAYQDNLALCKSPKEFANLMCGILPRIMTSFRIHVSGDYFDVPYIKAWIRICKEYPSTKFWCYTRTWDVAEMQKPLMELRDLPNMQMFASTDEDMPLPSLGWRVAFVHTDPRANGLPCSAQENEKDSCQVCGYCFRRGMGNVVFKVH